MIPFRDLLIALSFTYLYFYQGMKKREEEPLSEFSVLNKESMLQTINDDRSILNMSEAENSHDSVTHNVEEDKKEEKKPNK